MPDSWVKRAVKNNRPPIASSDTMEDPDTRFGVARHEAGHSVVQEALDPGSLYDVSLNPHGGAARYYDKSAGNARVLTPDDMRNLTAISLAGGLSEPGGTTVRHAAADRDLRNQRTGERASSAMSNIRRIVTGGAGPNDPMLEAPKIQAEGQARANLVLQDPLNQKRIDSLASNLNRKGKLSGDEAREDIYQ